VLRKLCAKALDSRVELQDVGSVLERETGSAWLANYVDENTAAGALIVVDAIRTAAQFRAFRAMSRYVVAIHLTAATSERRRRFESRQDPADAGGESFDRVTSHWLEGAADEVAELANAVIDTTDQSPDETLRATLLYLDNAGGLAGQGEG
jgi:hypothetical protein